MSEDNSGDISGGQVTRKIGGSWLSSIVVAGLTTVALLYALPHSFPSGCCRP